MQVKELQPGDIDLVRTMWAKRGELVTLGFNIRQQYLETEQKVYLKVDELDSELNTMVKLLREKLQISDEWKLDLARGVFVGPAVEAPSGDEPEEE